jgi:hypothetical protein
MPVREVLMKTAAILMFAVATVLALHAEKLAGLGIHRAKYFFFSSLVLFIVGAFFFVFPMAKDMSFMRRPRRSPSDLPKS